ncbi:AarF/ABC1/UbiB kinase family protein, partial [Leptolyngbya sp. FACHB-36]|nr:AarF/ABC1/UbiB kinase family protein [Leptolyngbya sp. FACHB-36]
MSVKTASPEFSPAASVAETQPLVAPTLMLDRDVPAELEELRSAEALPMEPEAESLRYDAEAVEAHYRGRPFQVMGRLLQIVLPFMSLTLRWWWNRRMGASEQQQRQQAIRLREVLTRLGPAFIKVGQALSTRPDLVPPL